MTVARESPRGISRQAFLRGAVGALAAGAVFGSNRASADPRTSGWGDLSAAIGGRVILPDSGGQFASAKMVFNTNFNELAPAGIVIPASAVDVQKAMEFAAAHNLKVAPRGGGHSYVGASTATGTMVLDLRELPGDINYDAATGHVTVTPATGLYAIHQALAGASRGIPTGTCPTVGAAGQVARMRQCAPCGSVMVSANAQLLRSAVRSQFCHPTRTCAKDCSGKLRLTTSTSLVGKVAKVRAVVTPKLPPPPPCNAQ